jgi:hypothetical protein
MVRDDVWEQAWPDRKPAAERKQYDEILCPNCLEARIGRQLTANDFSDAPVNRSGRKRSARLRTRLGI